MMKTLLKLIVMIIAVNIYAQGTRGTSNIADGVKLKKNNPKGHAFLLNDWVTGFVVDNNGKMSESMKLNYDIHTNQLTYKNSAAKIMVVGDHSYSGFILNDSDKQYLFGKIEGHEFYKAKKESKFYEIVSPPSRNVIVETVKKMDDPNASGWSSSSSNNKAVEYDISSKIYVLGKNKKYQKVNASNAALLKVFKDKKSEIASFLKSNSINVKSAADMDAVVSYYHSL